MFKITLLLLLSLLLYSSSSSVPRLQSFRQLGTYHCKATNLPLLYLITSGSLAQFYGPAFKQYDAYIRSFVGPDFYYRQDTTDDQDEQQSNPYKSDPIVEQYLKGINDCGLDWTEKHIYQIWRYIRFMVNSDYLFEWLRAKMRISYGYEIQKPNAWMDGQQRQDRLRLEKLYSNQYLYSLEDLMHRDYLFPMLTTLRKNVVVAATGSYTQSGKPLLVNVWETRNYPARLFHPVQININDQLFFSFTIPGIPLLLSGASKNIAWAFSGILVDRTNVEQIETTGMRFFDEDNERWVKIKKMEEFIKVKGQDDYKTTYYWSKEGPLVSKSDSKSKIREFIIKWHENEPKVRVLFSQLVTLLKNPTLRLTLHFPFNSLVLVDNKGIHHHVCPPRFPYYFLYPDMLGQPQSFQGKQLWASNPKRGFFTVSNTRLSSTKPLGYLDKEVFNVEQQALANLLKQLKENKKDIYAIIEHVAFNCQTANAKKIVDNLLTIYRKAKFTYLPNDIIRNQNDQLVAMLDKWDKKITHPKLGAIYRLWLYFLKMNTFGHSARSQFAKDIARFKLSTDTYFAGQTELWKGVASYGECNIDQYNDKIEIHVNHTGHNSSCYYNILKSINETRLFFINEGGNLLNTENNYYNSKKTWNPLRQKYWKIVKDVDTAFLTTFKEKLVFGVEVGSGNGVVYSSEGIEGLKGFVFGEGKKWVDEDYEREKKAWEDIQVQYQSQLSYQEKRKEQKQELTEEQRQQAYKQKLQQLKQKWQHRPKNIQNADVVQQQKANQTQNIDIVQQVPEPQPIDQNGQL